MTDLPEFYQKHYSHSPWVVHVLPVTLYVPTTGSREGALEFVREILEYAGHDIGLVMEPPAGELESTCQPDHAPIPPLGS